MTRLSKWKETILGIITACSNKLFFFQKQPISYEEKNRGMTMVLCELPSNAHCFRSVWLLQCLKRLILLVSNMRSYARFRFIQANLVFIIPFKYLYLEYMELNETTQLPVYFFKNGVWARKYFPCHIRTYKWVGWS